MKKTLILLVMVVLMMTLTSGVAMASGWWDFGAANADNADPNDPNNGSWASNESPHWGFSTTSNKCKTCHATHEANADSYRLLHNSSRVSECNWCHDASAGVSAVRPYQVGDYTTVRGEHHIGSTVIPGAIAGSISNSIATDGLVCGNCHSVHGAKVVNGATFELGTDPGLDDPVNPTDKSLILKNDPAENGGSANVGTDYNDGSTQSVPGGFLMSAVTGYSSFGNTDNYSARIKTAFCADCHNANVNQDDSADDSGRPNKSSHVQGRAADGQIEVYGTTQQVANFGTWANAEVTATGVNRSGSRLAQNTVTGCRSCHQARDSGMFVPWNNNSAWPHQSRGSKFLIDNYTNGELGWTNAGGGTTTATTVRQTNRTANIASRDLNNMDKVCLDCHRDQRGLGTDTQGVGITF